MQEDHNSKSKIEDLFTHEIDDRLSYFYTSNQIIASSELVYHFFINFQDYPIGQQVITYTISLGKYPQCNHSSH
jgi:hypothetical protein